MVLVLNWDELEKASSSHPGTHVLNMWGNNTSNGLKMWKYNDSTILTSIWVDDYQQYPLTEGSNATWLSESDKNNYAITKDEYALQLEGYDSDMFVVALTNDGNGMVTVNVLKNDMQTVGSAYVMDSSVPTASFTMAGFYTDTAAVHKAILFDDVLTAEQLAYVAVQSGLTVPEPATASLSLLGLAALMMRRRRA